MLYYATVYLFRLRRRHCRAVIRAATLTLLYFAAIIDTLRHDIFATIRAIGLRCCYYYAR